MSSQGITRAGAMIALIEGPNSFVPESARAILAALGVVISHVRGRPAPVLASVVSHLGPGFARFV